MRIILALCIVPLLLLGGCAVNKAPLSPLSDEEWEMYANSEGFSMRYPAEWKVVENMSGARVFFLAPPTNGFSNNFNFITQSLATADIRSLRDFDRLTAKQVQEMSNTTKLKRQRTEILGMPCSRYDYSANVRGQEMRFRQWVFIKGEAAYLFTYTDLATSFRQNEDKANRIMESFSMNHP